MYICFKNPLPPPSFENINFPSVVSFVLGENKFQFKKKTLLYIPA